MCSKGNLCGGMADVKEVDDKIKEIVKKHHPDVEAKLGRKLERLEPVSCRTQLVAGINYFVKCHVGGDEYVHIRIYEQLPCNGSTTELTAVHPDPQTLDAPLTYFQ